MPHAAPPEQDARVRGRQRLLPGWPAVCAALALAAGVWVWWEVVRVTCERPMELHRLQLEKMAHVLDAWRDDNGAYPHSLAALLTPGDAGFGPYATANDLVDLRGRPLAYLPNADGSGFQLSTLGADGRPGGTGAAADRTVRRPERMP